MPDAAVNTEKNNARSFAMLPCMRSLVSSVEGTCITMFLSSQHVVLTEWLTDILWALTANALCSASVVVVQCALCQTVTNTRRLAYTLSCTSVEERRSRDLLKSRQWLVFRADRCRAAQSGWITGILLLFVTDCMPHLVQEHNPPRQKPLQLPLPTQITLLVNSYKL